MRQGQALVMTPQLMQAIKLLQLSNLELASFIEEELERNPLLERADDAADPRERDEAPVEERPASDGDPAESDWATEDFETDRGALEASLGTEIENSFERDGPAAPESLAEAMGLWGPAGGGGPAARGGGGGGRARRRPRQARGSASNAPPPPAPRSTSTSPNSSRWRSAIPATGSSD